MAETAFEEKYMHGFGNEFETEALEGALPQGLNAPQKCAYKLYAEQLSGTAFTHPRATNQRTWLYRIRPSVVHEPFAKYNGCPNMTNDFGAESKTTENTPNQFRWSPWPLPKESEEVNFVQGLNTVSGAGSPATKTGLAIYVYACNKSMGNSAFYNSDGDFLIVPQEGKLTIKTEMGIIIANPREICVIQRGIKFSVDVDGPSRGYICESFGAHYRLPDLGVIGANGLANARDFEIPCAWYEDLDCDYPLYNKFCGEMFVAQMNHSPFDIVAWHGNYAPYKYDLDKFCCINSVTYDHPDPSIYCVLTAPSGEPGTAMIDFVIFPPRWVVIEKSFRPPYYHRNTMSEYMGNISGVYDAKEKGFLPGGGSLHSTMTAHGPEKDVFDKASNEEHVPVKYPQENLAFMFETCALMRVANKSMDHLEKDYYKCWQGLEKNFDGTK